MHEVRAVRLGRAGGRIDRDVSAELELAWWQSVLESLLAKMRLFRVPEFMGMAFLLALLALSSDSMLR